MNVWTGYGRLVKDVELKTYGGDKTMATFTMAVQRAYKENGEYKSDFISCTVFNEHLVKLLPKFVSKGSRITVNGSLQINSTKKDDGSFQIFPNIIVDKVSWVETANERKEHDQEETVKTAQSVSKSVSQSIVNEDDFPF